jgi:hypothetical protein
MIASVFFSTSNVATTSTAKENPIIRYPAGRPSRNITRKNAKNTSANPVSFWAIVITAGNNTIPAAISCDLGFVKSVSILDKYLASARFTNTLHSSAGCNWKEPNLIIEFVPFTSVWKGNTSNSNKIPNAYQMLAVAVKNLLSVNKMNKPRIREITKYRDCLP